MTRRVDNKKNFLTLLGKICDKFLLFVRGNFFFDHSKRVVNFRTLFLFLYSIYSILCYKLPLFFEGGRETSRRAKLSTFFVVCRPLAGQLVAIACM